MSMNASDINENEPLDPAVERVRRKMMRLMGISVAIMMIGLMAVIGAIFYKISGGGKKKPTATITSESTPNKTIDLTSDIVGNIKLPVGSKLLSAKMDAGRILITIDTGNNTSALWVYDLAANGVIAKISVSQ